MNVVSDKKLASVLNAHRGLIRFHGRQAGVKPVFVAIGEGEYYDQPGAERILSEVQSKLAGRVRSLFKTQR